MRNPIYEQELVRQGVQWKYLEKVELSQVDAVRGLRNQARLEAPLDDELVRQYKEAILDGADFPALVVWRPGPRSRLTPIDGNHTLAALTAAKKHSHDVYLVDCADPQVIDRMTWSFNNHVNGRRLSKDEALQHAVSFVRQYGIDANIAAKEWGLRHWEVKNAVKDLELRALLDKRQVPHKQLSPDKVKDLAPLANIGEDLFAEAARVANNNGLTSDDCTKLVKEVKKAESVEDKVQVVLEFATAPETVARRAETQGGRIKPKQPSPRDRFARALQQVAELLEQFEDPKCLRPLEPGFKRSREHAALVVEKLVPLFGLGRVDNGKA